MRSAARGPSGRSTVKEHLRGGELGAQHLSRSSAGCDENVMPAPWPDRAAFQSFGSL